MKNKYDLRHSSNNEGVLRLLFNSEIVENKIFVIVKDFYPENKNNNPYYFYRCNNLKKISSYLNKNHTGDYITRENINTLNNNFSDDKCNEIINNIVDRFTFLDKCRDNGEYEDNDLYEKTKKILKEIILPFMKILNLKTNPLIGVSDDGKVGVEWHNEQDYKTVFLDCYDKRVIHNFIRKK